MGSAISKVEDEFEEADNYLFGPRYDEDGNEQLSIWGKFKSASSTAFQEETGYIEEFGNYTNEPLIAVRDKIKDELSGIGSNIEDDAKKAVGIGAIIFIFVMGIILYFFHQNEATVKKYAAAGLQKVGESAKYAPLLLL